MELMDDDDEVS